MIQGRCEDLGKGETDAQEEISGEDMKEAGPELRQNLSRVSDHKKRKEGEGEEGGCKKMPEAVVPPSTIIRQ